MTLGQIFEQENCTVEEMKQLNVFFMFLKFRRNIEMLQLMNRI